MMKHKINGYSLGKMIVGERTFTSDLIIHPDGRIPPSSLLLLTGNEKK